MSYTFIFKVIYILLSIFFIHYLLNNSNLLNIDSMCEPTYIFQHKETQLVLNKYENSMAQLLTSPTADDGIIIGHTEIIKELDSIIYLLTTHSNSTSSIVDPPNGILLYGPPGTGKTTIAKSIAVRFVDTCYFLHISPEIIENKYYGEGLKQLTAIFSLAKKIKPCVLFFDEIDGFMSTRSGLDQTHTNTMKTSFLTCMDSLQDEWNILLIATTNRKESLDPALLRRLDVHLNMGLPSIKDKCAFLRKYVANSNLTDDELSGFCALAPFSSICDYKNFCKYCVRTYLKDAHVLVDDRLDIDSDRLHTLLNQYIDLQYDSSDTIV
jgi:SpoVK/Ycf46/Vps4 family AAA+-type ATPase